MWAPQIKYTNKVLQPYLDSHSSPLANEDTATIAVTALTSSSLDNKAPILTGPRNITYREHLEAISKVRQETKGEPLKFEEVSGERWKEAMAGKVPTELADSLLDLWSKGVSAPYPVSHDFEQVYHITIISSTSCCRPSPTSLPSPSNINFIFSPFFFSSSFLNRSQANQEWSL